MNCATCGQPIDRERQWYRLEQGTKDTWRSYDTLACLAADNPDQCTTTYRTPAPPPTRIPC